MLDERGVLLLIKANPKEFELLSERQLSEEEPWAHLAVSGGRVVHPWIKWLVGLSLADA